MISFQSGQLLDALQQLHLDGFTGAVHIQLEPREGKDNQTYVALFYHGDIVFTGYKVPTIEDIGQLIAQRFNLTNINSALKAASGRVKNANSIRERLIFLSRFGLFKWEDLEAIFFKNAVGLLEQLLPYAGSFTTDASIDLDLCYGEDGQGLSWEKLQAELKERQQLWLTLAPTVPSMAAVPVAQTSHLDQLPELVRQHLMQWVDGQRSLLDIAHALNSDPLKLANHYATLVQQGWLTFRTSAPVPDSVPPSPLVSDPSPIIPDTPLTDLPIILSVDDSAIVQTMIKRAIGDRYQVLLANNAVQALNLLNIHNVSLLLLDVTMPDIDGLELCRTIRSIGKFRDLPVVMLTAKDGLMDKVKGQFAGTTHYLTKPVDRDKLLPVLEKYIPVAIKL